VDAGLSRASHHVRISSRTGLCEPPAIVSLQAAVMAEIASRPLRLHSLLHCHRVPQVPRCRLAQPTVPHAMARALASWQARWPPHHPYRPPHPCQHPTNAVTRGDHHPTRRAVSLPPGELTLSLCPIIYPVSLRSAGDARALHRCGVPEVGFRGVQRDSRRASGASGSLSAWLCPPVRGRPPPAAIASRSWSGLPACLSDRLIGPIRPVFGSAERALRSRGGPSRGPGAGGEIPWSN